MAVSGKDNVILRTSLHIETNTCTFNKTKYIYTFKKKWEKNSPTYILLGEGATVDAITSTAFKFREMGGPVAAGGAPILA